MENQEDVEGISLYSFIAKSNIRSAIAELNESLDRIESVSERVAEVIESFNQLEDLRERLENRINESSSNETHCDHKNH